MDYPEPTPTTATTNRKRNANFDLLLTQKKKKKKKNERKKHLLKSILYCRDSISPAQQNCGGGLWVVSVRRTSTEIDVFVIFISSVVVAGAEITAVAANDLNV